MTQAEKHILNNYSWLMEGLNAIAKLELIESLSKSLRKQSKRRDTEFYKSFGAFADERPAEELAAAIKQDRKFGKRNISF